MKFLGEVDPNAILRGEVSAEKGDIFTSASIDHCGVHVFQCVFPENPEKAHQNFRSLGSGIQSTREEIIRKALASA